MRISVTEAEVQPTKATAKAILRDDSKTLEIEAAQ